jgi:hypothetical protein
MRFVCQGEPSGLTELALGVSQAVKAAFLMKACLFSTTRHLGPWMNSLRCLGKHLKTIGNKTAEIVPCLRGNAIIDIAVGAFLDEIAM